jgi:hypothetical protein
MVFGTEFFGWRAYIWNIYQEVLRPKNPVDVPIDENTSHQRDWLNSYITVMDVAKKKVIAKIHSMYFLDAACKIVTQYFKC